MSDLAIIEPVDLEAMADPGAFVVASLERAKAWLEKAVEHGDIDSIKEWKSQAEAIRVYTVQKQLGEDAQLAANEIVLRATRALGKVARVEQNKDDGIVSKHGRNRFTNVENAGGILYTPIEIFGHERTRGDAYTMADATDVEFDSAIAAAKADKKTGLSRSNVVRHVQRLVSERVVAEAVEVATIDPQPAAEKVDRSREGVRIRIVEIRRLAGEGHSSGQIARKVKLGVQAVKKIAAAHGIAIPADVVLGRMTIVDVDRIVDESLNAIEAAAAALARIEDVPSLDTAKRREWLEALRPSLAVITRFRRELG